MITKLVVPDLAMLRYWLEQLSIAFFECNDCQALHLPHLQSMEGISDAKVDISENVIVFSALSEIRPTSVIPLVADLSKINELTLAAKVFIDIQDDHLPKLVVCQTLSVAVGITFEQFVHFLQESEEQALQVLMEAQANELLIIHETDEDHIIHSPVTHFLH